LRRYWFRSAWDPAFQNAMLALVLLGGLMELR